MVHYTVLRYFFWNINFFMSHTLKTYFLGNSGDPSKELDVFLSYKNTLCKENIEAELLKFSRSYLFTWVVTTPVFLTQFY